MYVAAFSQGNILRKTVMLQNAPFQYDPSERRDFSAYAAARKAGLSFNGLFYEWNNAVTFPYERRPRMAAQVLRPDDRVQQSSRADRL